MALKLNSLQALKIVGTHNPDAFIKNNSDTYIDNRMKQIADGKIAYNSWKKVKVQQGNGVAKEKMRLVRGEEDKNAFVGAFKKEIAEFRLHVSQIKN